MSKILWTVLSPDNLFLILLLGSLLLIRLKYTRAGMTLLTLISFGLLFLSIFAVGNWMLYPLESRFPTNPQLPARVDGIIVLGGSIIPAMSSEWGQLETNRYNERLSSSLELARQYPEASLVFTGGNASLDSGHPTEAEFARTHFLNMGVNESRLLIENRARNTAENASLTKLLVKPQPDQHWVLITTAFHMPRSIGVFCKQGWKVIPYPVDHDTLPSKLFTPGFSLLGNANTLVTAAHEWVGLLAYYLSAKTPSLFPGECHLQPARSK